MGRQLLRALAPAALTLVWAVGVSAFAQSPAQSPPHQPPPEPEPRQQAQPTQPTARPSVQRPRPTRPLPPDIVDHDSMNGAGNPQTYPNMPISRPTH